MGYKVYFHLNGISTYLELLALDRLDAEAQTLTMYPAAKISKTVVLTRSKPNFTLAEEYSEKLPKEYKVTVKDERPLAQVIRVDFRARKRVAA